MALFSVRNSLKNTSEAWWQNFYSDVCDWAKETHPDLVKYNEYVYIEAIQLYLDMFYPGSKLLNDQGKFYAIELEDELATQFFLKFMPG